MTTRLEGKPVADRLKQELSEQVLHWKSIGIEPRMVTLLIGNDKASEVYAMQKARTARRLGIQFEILRLPESTSQRDVSDRVRELSEDARIHGIMLELPLPGEMDSQSVVSTIHALKDVDGMSPCHSFARPSPDAALYPATPLACIRLLKHYGYELRGRDVTVVGCGQTVGLPLIHLLIAEGATVVACHEYTVDVRAHLQRSEFAFVAVGKGGLIKPDMVHDGLVVVDVGISQGPGGVVIGDLAADAAPLTRAYTPTPGGVGAVTTLQIFANLMHAMDMQYAASMIEA
ncbi:bifunctional 5,10-methylenetetrahydrofolate dehydrogenase/5,10-methenyltetrahydrofolate cyclohydrolase [Alicyclobacillus fastidiosus]|uniref:Bifunctional protein FolD n=1 Tax=Alicyclobacillus fastidiosus TaxID=392011 RepID=A0ABV5AFF5_9BACL|nr:bifunctional 5,10-methylenetetrahydrofolate dehydrogenase/5,10-methenyltetrahydrofolate cyclohydrolase [Alicyclobacillus fastidiosus]WEH09655.1 bifunctional 5,10-methylenetetrahydrofolate dehydrogenase/5,10-methenyltetrahydrofolate cyclohydrolase [Alicyclobacillus fastidiosus]